jgi:hypothetical protein
LAGPVVYTGGTILLDRKQADVKIMDRLPRPTLLSPRDESWPQVVDLRELWEPSLTLSRKLEAQIWQRFATAAGCPEALTEEDRRWLEAS